MIRAAQRVIFCFDSTKFGRRSLSPLCALERIHVIVTDRSAPPELVALLRQRGLEVVIAPATVGRALRRGPSNEPHAIAAAESGPGETLV